MGMEGEKGEEEMAQVRLQGAGGGRRKGGGWPRGGCCSSGRGAGAGGARCRLRRQMAGHGGDAGDACAGGARMDVAG